MAWLVVTPKLLQALIEGIPVITTGYFEEVEKKLTSLALPDPLTYELTCLLNASSLFYIHIDLIESSSSFS